jgi:predicted transcriptional regulator
MDDVSFELLKLYAKRKQLSAQDISAICNIEARVIFESIQYLANKEYLNPCIIAHETTMFNIPYQITHEGRIVLEDTKKRRHHFIFNEIRAWITLVIAVAAFIKSFFY